MPTRLPAAPALRRAVWAAAGLDAGRRAFVTVPAARLSPVGAGIGGAVRLPSLPKGTLP